METNSRKEALRIGVTMVLMLTMAASAQTAYCVPYKTTAGRWERIQQDRPDSLHQAIARCKDDIRAKHDTIVSKCMRKGQTPRRQEVMRDIYFSYMTVKNRYNLSDTTESEEQLHRLSDLAQLQQHLIDNVLNNGSYMSRIIQFRRQLKDSVGSEYMDIYWSYCQHFRMPYVSRTFITIEQYRDYAQKMGHIIEHQHLYLTTLQLRRLITANKADIAQTYARSHHRMWQNYLNEEQVAELTPKFTNYDEGTSFVETLRQFARKQVTYIELEPRLKALERQREALRDSLDNSGLKTYLQRTPKIETLTANMNSKNCDSIIEAQTEMLHRIKEADRQCNRLKQTHKKLQKRKDIDKKAYNSYKKRYTAHIYKSPTTPSNFDQYCNEMQSLIEQQDELMQEQ